MMPISTFNIRQELRLELRLGLRLGLILGLGLGIVSPIRSMAQSDMFHLSSPSAANSIFLRSSLGHNGNSKWVMKKADTLNDNGGRFSQPDFQTKGWLAAVVPGTVLNSLVTDGKYPDPYFGDNNRLSRKLIPDIANAGRPFYHYWFRTNFEIPESFEGKRVWLKFNGINYRTVIWLNGKRVGDMAGMFNAQAFDVTDLVNIKGNNGLAVDVLPVDYTGSNSAPKTATPGAYGEGQNGGDGEIGKNTTMLMTVGWDFTFPDGVRDRNTGIWKDVELYATGEVQIKNPYVQSKLPLPDTTSARETISLEVQNNSPIMQTGVLLADVHTLGIHIRKSLELAPHETKRVVLDAATYPSLHIKHPKLWWPIHKGNQHLYKLTLAYQDDKKPKGNISHLIEQSFGIRNITTDQNTPDSSRRFLVNGVPVFIRGANWIPEAMCKNTEQRTYTELRYIHQAGFNLLRLWGGGIAESDYFYHLCDSLGIMVWSEFWITGNTRFPADTAIYMNNLRNTIKRIRPHASVAYYVSANESTELPGAELVIKGLDSMTNYQRQSECCGVHDGSPYTYVNPMQYFENTASKRGSRVDGFNPEYGAPCLPIQSSLIKMMPEKDLWPINKRVWDYMDGGGFHKMTTDYHQAVEEFGTSKSLAEYARKAQLVGAMNYRSIMEVWDYNKFNHGDRFASGFLFWYINSAEPQVASRLYDWSLEPTAALYYAKNALEPLHVQFDYLKNTVSIYNDYRQDFKDYELNCDVYDLDMRQISHQERRVDISQDGVLNDVLKIEFPDRITPVHFIKLRLKDAQGHEIASSFYWRSTDSYKGAWTISGPAVGGFRAISQLGKAQLRIKTQLTQQANGQILDVKLRNTGATLAFFTQLQLVSEKGDPIQGAFYSDNFINLLPGEEKKITIELNNQGMCPVIKNANKIKLQVSGINMDLTTLDINQQ